MPRRMDPAVRRRVMASIRKRDTVPELTLRAALTRAGVRGWRCHARLPGTPDVAFTRWKVAVFADGVWWHGREDYRPNGRRGPYWDAKIAQNVARDRQVNDTLRAAGWLVVRLWDLDILADPDAAAETVISALMERGWSPPRATVTEKLLVDRVPFRERVAQAMAGDAPSPEYLAQQRRRDL